MVVVDGGEHRMLHVSVLRVPGDVHKIEFHRLSVRRRLGHHARPISGVAIVRQQQVIAVQIYRGDGIVSPAF